MAMTETAQDRSTLTALPLPNPRPGMIFRRTLRDNLMSSLGWGLGYSALIALAALLYPLLNESNTLFTLLNGFGLLDNVFAIADVEELTGFPGYLALQAMGWGPLVFSVYLIPQALRAVAVEERQGTLDILLSTPISRWRLLTEKTLAIIASFVGILALMLLAMLVSSRLLAGVDLAPLHMVASVWHLLPISLTILTGTLLISLGLRNHRQAGALAAFLVMGSYFSRSLANLVSSNLLDTINTFSIFSYYRSVAALAEGFQWEADMVLLAVAAILFVLALIAFERRDLGV